MDTLAKKIAGGAFFAFILTGFSHYSLTAQQLPILAQSYAVHLQQTQDLTLEVALQKLEESYNIKFSYPSQEVKAIYIQSGIHERKTIEEILEILLNGTNLSFKRINKRYFIIYRKEDTHETLPPSSTPTDRSMYQDKISQVFAATLTGKITDTKGTPIPGVTVLLKGTTTGTASDSEGEYTLQSPEANGVLVFSYIGTISKEVAFNGSDRIDVTLEEDSKTLEEVVVIGYGTAKKSDLTGAVSSVSEKELQSRPVPSFQESIMGRSPGVLVRQSGGDLGGKYSISIRGVGSVTGNNDPLIVVDGVPLFSADFSTINPKDIISVDILKDASATAIYGARAANGVVIVSTKRGHSGKPQLTFSIDQGLEEITRNYDVMSTEQQRQLFVEAFKNSGRSTAGYDDPTAPAWQIDTDWQDLATRTAHRQNYNLGISGGSDRTQYAASLSYLKREGTFINSDLESWSLRTNVDARITDRLKIVTNLTSSHQRQNVLPTDQWQGGYRSLFEVHSYTEPFDENGNLYAINTTAAPYFGSNNNPLIDLWLPIRESNQTRILGNSKIDLEILNGLILSGNLGGDILLSEGYNYLPVYKIGVFARDEGSVTNLASQQINWVSDLTLTYNKKINKHSINALAGFSAQQFYVRSNSATGTGTRNNSLNQLSNQSNFIASGSEVLSGLLSNFLRLNYSYNNKYLLTATIRRDGSSKFGPNRRYGTFPSASVAWRISDEGFLHQSVLVNDLKLRVSYGMTGNQNIQNFAFITRAGAASYVFGNGVVIGNAPQNIGNLDLKWESAKQWDIGLDAAFWAGRLSMNLDYYDKRSEDLLIDVPIALTAGVNENPTVNLGSVKNSGFEFAATSRNLTGRISWTTDFNLTYNKNKVLNIGTNSVGDPLQIPGENIPLANEPANLTVAGHPIGAFYMRQFDGIWQLGQEDEAALWSGAVPGDARYKDLNGNNRLDEGDKTFVGNPQPEFFGGMNNTVSYKNFSLSVFLNFATGYQLYNSARNLLARSVPFVQNFAEVADFWTPENPSNKVPRPSQGGNSTFLSTRVSTRFLEDADFLRVKNVSLSYNLPDHLLQKLNFQSVRLTLSGTNLFTFTKYTGLDPEASSRASLLSAGIDHTPYPLTRLYSLGANVTF